MTWLLVLLGRAWLWRHRGIYLSHGFFTGEGIWWCGHCGGEVHTQERAGLRKVHVVSASCPAGRLYQWAAARSPT